MITSKLNHDILTDENNYFITFLTDRFSYLNALWARALERKFGGTYIPITILPAEHNSLFREENYIVLNEKAENIAAELKRDDVIYLVYPEEINKQFSQSTKCRKLASDLVRKQGRLFLLSFSSVWLDFDDPKIIILGPDPRVSEKYDNKVEHIQMFKKLGMAINRTEIYPDLDSLMRTHMPYPIFVSASYSSGGYESKVVFQDEDLEVFRAILRPINAKGKFVAAKFLNNLVHSPNSTAFVSENTTTMMCVSDQILRGNSYIGNLYPSLISVDHHERVCDMTIKMGEELRASGFRGLFGCDFIITATDDCFPVDLNPRRQGGYFCLVGMSKKIDIVELELAVALGEKTDKFTFEDIGVDYAWGHSKLTPFATPVMIEKEFSVGDPFGPFSSIGAAYSAQYYPKGQILLSGNPGFYLTTSKSRTAITKKLISNVEKLISTSLRSYEL